MAGVAARLLCARDWAGVGTVGVLGPEDLSANDMADIMSEVLVRPVSYRRQSHQDLAAMLASYGASEAFIQGIVDMMRAKDAGLDDRLERTTQNASSTTFRQWCIDVLRPAISMTVPE
jgi:uncharacterized protein YbjT (DUF2867 family)